MGFRDQWIKGLRGLRGFRDSGIRSLGIEIFMDIFKYLQVLGFMDLRIWRCRELGI